MAVKRALEKDYARIRVLSREELKIEVKKYKNMSLKIVEDFKKLKLKAPKYASALEKENEDENRMQLGEGLEMQRSAKSKDDFDDESMFEDASEAAAIDIPVEVADKIEKLEDQVTRLNQDLKDKNEKLIELLSELEDVKV